MTKTPINLQDLRRKIYTKAKADTAWRFWGLYVHVCKMETLREAYKLAKENEGSAGVDGVTFDAVESAGLDLFLVQIQGELTSRTFPTRWFLALVAPAPTASRTTSSALMQTNTADPDSSVASATSFVPATSTVARPFDDSMIRPCTTVSTPTTQATSAFNGRLNTSCGVPI